MTNLQKLAATYALLFFTSVILGHLPGIADENGLLFGLFDLDIKDDILHGASAIWAASAALYSFYAARFYFRLFGFFYFLDSIIGLLFGAGILDFGIFISGPTTYPFMDKVFHNLPHALLGGFALMVGFLFDQRLHHQK
ncbi:MAG: hypothetical protein P1V18_00715 [Candidatus Gracilibacteria bacterium]|nr:hypothetical protein [Candidatus Gracilibacteria bacterium]